MSGYENGTRSSRVDCRVSVPRNIDPDVDRLDQAYLFNIDDLRQVMEEGREARAVAGTPGAQNSTFQENVGPTYDGFRHSPATPAENQEVTVTVSLGGAEISGDEDGASFLARAEDSLNAARKEGGNCSYFAAEDGERRLMAATAE